MANIPTNEFKVGLKILLDNDPCSIIENEFVKPGKGQAFNRVKVKNLRTARVWEKTFKSGDTVESADIIELDMEYLYSDDQFYYFMMIDGSFEQYVAEKKSVSEAHLWLKVQEVYAVTLFNDVPLYVQPPNHIELEVIETDPGLRGDTAQGGTKPAKLSTGVLIQVPLFIEIGDVLRVDTRNSSYIGRASRR